MDKRFYSLGIVVLTASITAHQILPSKKEEGKEQHIETPSYHLSIPLGTNYVVGIASTIAVGAVYAIN